MASRPETSCHEESGTVVSRDATRPCEDNSRRHQGVWHARATCATADGVTLAAVRGHSFGDSVAPPAWVRGQHDVEKRSVSTCAL